MLALTIFTVQVIFLFGRTWNVRATASGNINQTLVSGALVHLSWLVGTAIGVHGMQQILFDFAWRDLPIVACSLAGSLLGTYLGFKTKK